MDLNKVMLIGRLTHDPEIKTIPSGTQVASFGLATNFKWKDANGIMQEKTEFSNIIAWRKLAEICGQYLKKGNKAYIEGRLQTRDWTGQDGVKRYRTEIIADNMIMLENKTNQVENKTTQSVNNVVNDNETPIIDQSFSVDEIPF